MERFHGNRLKNLNSRPYVKITTSKNKFRVRGWHRESSLKLSGTNRVKKPIFKIKQNMGKKELYAVFN